MAEPILISGGYRIVSPMTPDSHMNTALLPRRCVTQSECLTSLAPDAWAIRWASEDDDTRARLGSKFGLDATALEDFIEWATGVVETETMGWPGVFFEAATAVAAKARFMPGADALVCGLALAADDAQEFVGDTEPQPGVGLHGVEQAVRRGVAPAPGGRLLGFDVLGWDIGGFHSFICNGLESEFEAHLGLTPNEHGLYDTFEAATACAAFAGLDSTGAEPCLWQSWEVRAYA